MDQRRTTTLEAHVAMNSLHSTPLLAVDPALPQRDLLLDEAVMKEYLSRLVGPYGDFDLEHCERLRTKYRIGRSLRVLYELSGSSHSHRIAARAFPRTHRVSSNFSSPVEIHAPELNTMFWVFPHDRKIKHLSLLYDVPAHLRRIQGHAWIKSRVVGHAPEKSVTAQCLDQNDEVLAYAKIYAGDEGRDYFNTYAHLAGEFPKQSLHVPRALTYSEEHHVLLLEPVAGVSLSAFPRALREKAFSRLGRALKEFHGTTPPPSLPQSSGFNPEALTRTAATISEARPDVAAQVQRLTHELVTQYERHAGSEPVLLHGDVHPKNVLLDGERLCLLDLDQAAIGVAAVDLGSVLAGLYCDACVGSITWREARVLTRAVLTGYGPLGVQSVDSLWWHVAAAMLQERALRAVTRIRTHVLQQLPQILQTAEDLLNGGISEN